MNAHLTLVVKIARDFRHLHANLLELIQEGGLALTLAVHRYDPERGTISAYVASWVRTYLERFVVAALGGPAYPELIGSTGMHGAGAPEAHAMKAQTVPAKAY